VLAKTYAFKKILDEEIKDRGLVPEDVRKCAGQVYHEESKHAHGNTGMITVYWEDHVRNEVAALVAFPVTSVWSVHLWVRTGRTAYLRGHPGQTGILASVWKTARDGRAGTTGVSGGGICSAPPRDRWALKVTGPEVPPGNWRRQQVTADDRGVRLRLLTSKAMA